jgi:pyrimidine-nucleoside phosphorylase
LTAYEIILKKRDGGELSRAEIAFMVEGFLENAVADYQMSAFLMAVFFVGMSDAETDDLTSVMLETGSVLDLSAVPGSKVDKHSTGGVGDKLSLVVAPVAAAAGVRVPMISGRGLGHTGGTLDKLESIPGLRTDLSRHEFERVVADVGMAIVGQSPDVAPADRSMYALRDVTATIECVPLIVSSILSKKLAAGLDGLVLDVKVGRGAFMRDVESGRALAERLLATAHRLGLPADAVLTDMESPLGRAVGNALEVSEAVDVLSGEGPSDVRETSLTLASRMLVLAGLARDGREASARANEALDGGQALGRFARFVEAQGGDPSFIDRRGLLPAASVVREVRSDEAGFVTRVDAMEIGLASTELGAGRREVGDPVDPAVGIEIVVPVGGEVHEGGVLALVRANDVGRAEAAVGRAGRAFEVGPEQPAPRPRVLEVIEGPGTRARTSTGPRRS